MGPMSHPIRMYVATVLLYWAARVVPAVMRPVFTAYVDMLERFPDELRQGRTFGVITVPWSCSPDDALKARVLQADHQGW